VTFPFSAPYINSSLEGAIETLQVAGADQSLQAVGLSPSVNGQFRIGKLGVELGASLQETFGSNAYSAYVLGANLDYIFSTTFRYEAWRSKKAVLTPALFLSYDKGFGFSPLNAVNLALGSPDQAASSALLTRTTTEIVRPELLGAYAFSPAFGVTGELGTGFIYDTAATQPHTQTVRLGVALDLNLAPVWQVPIGVATFFSDEFPINSSAQSTPILGLGGYEMLNSNFNFGLEVARLMVSSSSLSILLSLTAYY
jgi:hypothetical protein